MRVTCPGYFILGFFGQLKIHEEAGVVPGPSRQGFFIETFQSRFKNSKCPKI
jgi:hypothetical protein